MRVQTNIADESNHPVLYKEAGDDAFAELYTLRKQVLVAKTTLESDDMEPLKMALPDSVLVVTDKVPWPCLLLVSALLSSPSANDCLHHRSFTLFVFSWTV
jgi:hypothetical protein